MTGKHAPAIACMQRGVTTDQTLASAGRLPFRVVAASIVGAWLAYFMLLSIRSALVLPVLQSELIWRRGLVCLAGALITLLLWLCLTAVARRSLGAKILVALVAAAPAAFLTAQVNIWLFKPLEARIEQQIGRERGFAYRRDEAGNLLLDLPRSAANPATGATQPPSILIAPAPTQLDRWRQAFEVSLSTYYLLLTWAAIYLALLAGAQARAAERRAGEFARAANAAELRSLRYQINPHFLFNTLNSLSALVMTKRTADAEEMIHNISHFYRQSLAGDRSGDVPLEEEFALQQLYLEIEKVRFPRRLKTRIDLPAELAGVQVPGMILQPLVENSVKYAVAKSNRPVTIKITAREEDGWLVLTVSDDGPAGDKAGGGGLGIGLANVRDRLLARFGERARVTAGSSGEGFQTELRIPLEDA